MNGVLVLGAALLCALMVFGCASGSRAEREVGMTTVILVRHAEKEAGPDPALSPAGRARAQALVGAVRDALPAGERLHAVLATNTKRAAETARLAAEAHGIGVTIVPLAGGVDGYYDDVVRRIREEHVGQNVLVVGHSNTTPELVERLAGVSGLSMSEAEYERLFIVKLYADGWRVCEERKYGK